MKRTLIVIASLIPLLTHDVQAQVGEPQRIYDWWTKIKYNGDNEVELNLKPNVDKECGKKYEGEITLSMPSNKSERTVSQKMERFVVDKSGENESRNNKYEKELNFDRNKNKLIGKASIINDKGEKKEKEYLITAYLKENDVYIEEWQPLPSDDSDDFTCGKNKMKITSSTTYEYTQLRGHNEENSIEINVTEKRSVINGVEGHKLSDIQYRYVIE